MEPTLLTDEARLRLLLARNSFSELYGLLNPYVQRWCSGFGLPGDEVDEMVQRVWDHLHDLTEKYGQLPFDPTRASSFLGWVFRVAHNVVLDYQRKRRRVRKVPDVDPSAVDNMPAPARQGGIQRVVEDDFWTAVASRLDERSRKLLYLYREGETSPGTLQQLLGVSQPTLWRTREKIQQVVQELLSPNETE